MYKYFILILILINGCYCWECLHLDRFNISVSALILARGGSKGIRMKNLAKLNGTSLLGRSIKVLKEFKRFRDVWVSTDNQEIADEADLYGAQIHWRSPEFAHDTTASIESVNEFIKRHHTIKYIFLIQVTSPFLKTKYLKEAFDLFQANSHYSCIFSVSKSYKLRWKYQNYFNNYVQPLNFDLNKRPRRQDWNGELIENGMFYLTQSYMIQNGYIQNYKCGVVLIDPEDSHEIDTPFDLKLAEFMLQHQKNYNTN